MKPDHIVILNDFAYVNGGAGQVALSSALGLAERGLEVTVFAAVGPAWASLSSKRIRLVCTGQQDIASDANRMKAAAQGLWNYRAAQQMKVLLQSLDPSRTVVHLHGWSKSLSASVIRRVRAARFRTVVTMHDYFLACPNGGFFDFQNNRICTLEPMSRACVAANCDKNSYAQKLWRVGRQAVQRGPGGLPSGIDDFIAISEFSRQILQPYLPPHARLHTVPNPIAVPHAPPVRPDRNHTVVFVGRLEPEKGPLLLAEAATRIGIRCAFVGDGSLRERLIKEYPEMTTVGWLPSSDVQRHIASARALVLPSRWYETQGLVVLEAAARGVPAIVPHRCAAADLVVDGVTGIIFKSGDCDDLTDKLRVLRNDALVARLGATAFDRYWEKPATMDLHLDTLLKVYDTMLTHTSTTM